VHRHEAAGTERAADLRGKLCRARGTFQSAVAGELKVK